MAKSTVEQALASLKQKFQAKIREVGQLKRELAGTQESSQLMGRIKSLSNTLDLLTVENKRMALRNDTLSNELLKLGKRHKMAEFELAQSDAAYRRLESHIKDVDGVQRELKADVSYWKSFTPIAAVLGAVVGALSAAAYIVQTAPL